MSKIVMLGLHLQAPELIGDTVKDLLATHPQLAKLLADQKNNQQFIELIKELAIKSLQLVAQARSGQVTEEIQGYYGQRVSDYNNQNIIAAIKTSKVPRGMGLVVSDKGQISFIADDFGVSHELKQLQEDFKTVFAAQATQTVMDLLGYRTAMSEPQLVSDKVYIQLQGARQ